MLTYLSNIFLIPPLIKNSVLPLDKKVNVADRNPWWFVHQRQDNPLQKHNFEWTKENTR